MMFRSLDCPCDENKKQSLEIHCFLDCSLFSTVSRNFWIRIYHDKKLGETIHRNGSNSMPASAQTKQAAFLMAIQHWEGESRSWSWQRNDLRTEERPSRFTGWLTGLERNLWAAYFHCMHLPHWGSSHCCLLCSCEALPQADKTAIFNNKTYSKPEIAQNSS